MGFIKKLAVTPPGNADKNAYWIVVMCNRCNEILRTRVHLQNDLSIDYSEGGTVYFSRKTLIGNGPCFQRVEVELTFNENRRLINREITGGEFVE